MSAPRESVEAPPRGGTQEDEPRMSIEEAMSSTESGEDERPETPAGSDMMRISKSRSIARSQNGYSCDDHPSDDEKTAQGNEAPADEFEVAFDGGDADPACPRSMGTLRKWVIVSIVSGGSFCVTAASSIYSTTYAQMNQEFGSSRFTATLGLSSFVLGISIGPMIFGPLSEFYGRRPIYLVSWFLFLLWIVPSAVAKNLATMVVARFFDGLAGSAFLAVSGGTVSDLFARKDLQPPMLMYSLAPFLGPTTGPVMGGFINYYTSWRWTYYVLLIWAFVLFLLIIFLVPETYHRVVLRNKAKRIRAETGDQRWKAPMEKTDKSIVKAIGLSLLRPFQLLIFETMVLSLCLFCALLLGILYLFFGAFPLVFGKLHGFNLWQTGLSFLGLAIGMLLAVAGDYTYHRMEAKRIEEREAQGIEHKAEPEDRLPTAIVGAFLVTGGLFIFAWTSYADVHWIAPIIGSGVFAAGTLLVFTGIYTFLVDAYSAYAASALAANAFVRCIFAAAFPLFGVQMYEKLGYNWATSLLGFLTVAMLPFPYIFWRYGHKIRERSRFCSSL